MCFDTLVENLIAIKTNEQIKYIRHDEHMFLEIKDYLANVTKGLILLCYITLFLVISLTRFLWDKNTLRDYF